MSDETHQNLGVIAKYERQLDLTREYKKKKEKAWEEKIKVESGEVIRRLPLAVIKLDTKAYPASQRRKGSVREHLKRLLSGQVLSPVTVMMAEPASEGAKKRYLLVDGYAVWKAHQQRATLYKDGKVSTSLSQVEFETIMVKIVDAPVHQKTTQDLRNTIRQFYEQFPGYPESRMAKALECDIKTIKKYCADLITQWKKGRIEMIKDLNSQGKSNRDIAKALKHRWPSARGLSQTVINRLIHNSSTSE